MSRPNFEESKRIARRRLENGLSANLRYHSIAHTFEEVLPAVERIAEMEGISREDLLLLRTAAVYHDLGFLEQSEDHEAVSARIAAEILPLVGYSTAQIEVIRALILATRPPPAPKTRLEEILVDADLAVLGQQDFLQRIGDLRFELESLGTLHTDPEWFRRQIDFLSGHSYWTESARSLWDAGKRRNLRSLKQQLDLPHG